jgi:hypothetical protein
MNGRSIVVSIHVAASAAAPIKSVAKVIAVVERGFFFVYAKRYGRFAFCYAMFCVD